MSDCSFNKLFKLLIDKKMKKGELATAAHISPSSLARLGRDENVNLDILVRICRALDCSFDDIMEILPIKEDNENKPE